MTHWLLTDRPPIPDTPPNENALINPTPYQEGPPSNGDINKSKDIAFLNGFEVIDAAASAAAGAGAAAGDLVIRAASGPAMCTDLNDPENCPFVFPPGERPPIGWPQAPAENGVVATPKWPTGTPPPFPVFRPTEQGPVATPKFPGQVFRPTYVKPLEPGLVGRPRSEKQ